MLKKIAITGPESTGKSWLAEKLSQHYNCPWVPEFARTYLDSISRPYEEADLLTIARGQARSEDELAKRSALFLFCDTDLTVIKIWSEVKYGRCHPWILDELSRREYSLYLLMDTGLPWEPDPQREHPEKRDYLFSLYSKDLANRKVPYKIISGLWDERLENAIRVIEKYA